MRLTEQDRPRIAEAVKKSYEMETTTLNDVFARRAELTAEEIAEIVSLLASRCRGNKRQRLSNVLTYNTPRNKSCGIYDRVIVRPRVQYVAGQDYPGEIRTVRELIIGR